MTDLERANRWIVNISLPQAEFQRIFDELLPEHRWVSLNGDYLWEENRGKRNFLLNSDGGGVIAFVMD